MLMKRHKTQLVWFTLESLDSNYLKKKMNLTSARHCRWTCI